MEIETSRLKIRLMEKKDAPSLLKLLKNPRVSCFEDLKIQTQQEALDFKQSMQSGFDFAVAINDTDILIGILFGEKEEPDTFSLCYDFLEQYGGKGYAFEAVQAYLEYLFAEKGIRRVYAYVETENLSSQKLCLKVGMRQEGVFKEFISFVQNPDGSPKYEDTMQFAILKKEWEA